MTPSIFRTAPDMAKDNDKIRENRLRNAARRQGRILVKSRRRDPRAWDFGSYMLLDAATSAVVAAGPTGAYGLTLDQVEDVLEGR